jgi:hypothetical protein
LKRELKVLEIVRSEAIKISLLEATSVRYQMQEGSYCKELIFCTMGGRQIKTPLKKSALIMQR